MRSVEPPAPARTWPERFGRLHEGETLRLHLRNLYIVPTRFGGLWLAGAILLQVVGIQTQRNGPLLLSFLMLALLLLALLLTHANLQGLELRCAEPRAGFASEPLTYPLQVLSDSPRDAIDLRLEAGAAGLPKRLNAGSNPVELGWRCNQRGWHAPGPLLIRSTAPMGLFVCWSRWQPPARQLVYPAPRTVRAGWPGRPWPRVAAASPRCSLSLEASPRCSPSPAPCPTNGPWSTSARRCGSTVKVARATGWCCPRGGLRRARDGSTAIAACWPWP